MKRDRRSVEDLLRQSRPPEVPQMATSLRRVLDRLEADHGAESDAAMAEWDGDRRTRSFRPVLAAAALVIVAVGGAMVWPRGVQAYAAGADGLQVTLADDSRVEMRAHAEMAVDRAPDGVRIDLKRGDIIVTAAEQRDGRLYVETTDMTVAVAGTVFLANGGQEGSRVAVIDGEARVRERGTPPRRSGRHGDMETRLRPGEELATSPTIARRPLAEDITWSRNANAHLAILDSFKKGMAQTAGPLATVATPRQVAAAGQAARNEFEEASIRECDPNNIPAPPAGARGGGANSFYMTPGRTYVLCMTLATIIRHAYGYSPANMDFATLMPRDIAGTRPPDFNTVYGLGVEDGVRVRGGPDWVRSQRYTIEAVADGATDGPTMRGPMLRALLERRFKLKAHIETEQIPAYALVVAAGGLKIKPAAPDSCFSYPPDPTVPRLNGVPVGARRPMLADVRRGEKRVCGQLPERNGPNQVFVAGGVTFSQLAQLLAARLGRVRVEDKTGITEQFDWTLEFADENPPGAAALNPQTAAEPSDVPRGPTIFVALEQQLGLRLEPTQTPREYIVIDAITRPDPN
jgi:uncharacterized protein (TIGR03435 family)